MSRNRTAAAMLAAVAVVAIGFGANVAQADPGNTNNNGNHWGWFKQEGSQNYNTTQYAASVPEPASLVLLGAGLAGIGIYRRMSRKP